jgi:hypothetical protein
MSLEHSPNRGAAPVGRPLPPVNGSVIAKFGLQRTPAHWPHQPRRSLCGAFCGRLCRVWFLALAHRTFQQSRVPNAATSPPKMASKQMTAIEVPDIVAAQFACSGI